MERTSFTKITAYHEHIMKQLISELISIADTETLLRKSLSLNKKNFKSKKIISKDDVYIQSIAVILYKDLSYYIEELRIYIEINSYKLIDVRYDYYEKNKIISTANIQLNFI